MSLPVLEIGGQLYATGLTKGKIANTAVVTFHDGTMAAVSTRVEKGYFVQDANGLVPQFLMETPKGVVLKAPYVLRNTNGINWISDPTKLVNNSPY